MALLHLVLIQVVTIETIATGNGIAVSGADASTGSTKTIALATSGTLLVH